MGVAEPLNAGSERQGQPVSGDGRPGGCDQEREQWIDEHGGPAFAPGADDSEPVRFAEEIARRAGELVLVAPTAREASALREWGLFAVARPEEGRWSDAALGALGGRDVVLIDAGAWDDFWWSEAEIDLVGRAARQVGTHTPHGCGYLRPGDLAAFVKHEWTAVKSSPALLAEEIRFWHKIWWGPNQRPFWADAADQDPEEVPDWPTLRFGRPPAAEPFPVDVFPEPVARFVEAVAEAVGAPADFAGLAVLVTAGAALGRKVTLELKPGYRVSPALFGLNVGGPASGTSASLAAVVQPLRAIDGSLQREYGEEQENYESKRTVAKQGRKDASAAPVLQSVLLEEFQCELVVPHLARNPGGLLVVCDEAAPWVASMARGAERRLWFSALRGLPLRIGNGCAKSTRQRGWRRRFWRSAATSRPVR